MTKMLIALFAMTMLTLAAFALPAYCTEDDEEEGTAEAGEGYYIETELQVPFAEAKEKVTAALKDQGFAVLTEIDLQAKFKEKLGQDIPPYTILGACGAGFAHRAWEINDDVGVMLPCTVVLKQDDEEQHVDVLFRDPRGLAQFDPALAGIGDEVYAKMEAVIEALGGPAGEDEDEDGEH